MRVPRIGDARLARLAAWLVLAMGGQALALDPGRAITQHILEGWTTEAGLPHSTVWDIAQTSDGYVWFGTPEGVARFDGVRFTVFDKRNTPALSGRSVNALAADGDNGLWLGTDDGLVRLQAGVFTHLDVHEPISQMRFARDGALWMGGAVVTRLRDGRAVKFALEPLLGPGDLGGFFEDAGGDMWMLADRGIARVRGDRLERVELGGGIEPPIYAVYDDGKGRRWVGHRRGLSFIEGGVVTAVQPGIKDMRFDSVIRITPDRDGNVWVGTGGGLYRYSDGKFSFLGRSKGLAFSLVTRILEDAEGSLWLGGLSGGPQRLRDGRVAVFGPREGLPPRGSVAAITQTEDGAMWIGCRPGGLTRVLDGVTRTFDSDQLGNNDVSALLAEPGSSLWVGTDVSLARWDGARFSIVDAGLGNVYALLRRRDGAVWAGTALGLRERTSDGKWQDRGPKGWAVLQLAEAPDGTLWAAGPRGLARFVDGALSLWDAAHGYPARGAGALAVDGDGTLWVGTMGDGLVRLAGGHAFVFDERHGLGDDDINLLLDDGDGHLWLGGNHGLRRVDKRELEAVAAGRAARVSPPLWLGRADGMKDIIFSNGTQPTAYKARDGKLWLATMDGGVVVVDPRRLATAPVPPPVVVERVIADGRVYEVPPRAGHDARVPPALTLPAGTRGLTVEYTALALAVPTRVRFRYRLVGYDRAWQEAANRRRADYTNLAPGRYRFEVIADKGDGAWSPAVSLPLELEPFFHQTRWFALLVMSAVAAAAFALYRLRVQGLLRREAELSQLVAEGTRSLREAQAELVMAERMASVATLVRGIAHELNNPIGFIVGNVAPLRRYSAFLVAMARQLGDGRARTAEELASLTRLTATKDLEFVARDLDKLMEDISEGARRAQLIVGDLQGLTAAPQRRLEEVDVGRAARQTLALLGPRLAGRTVVTELSEDVRVTAQAGQLEQVMVNLIDNAAWAVGPSGRVTVRVTAEGDRACLVVADDGPGMSEDVKRRATEPFFTTRAAGEGSGLGLAIVAAIVAAHHGSLRIDSAPGRGTTITVELPRDSAAA